MKAFTRWAYYYGKIGVVLGCVCAIALMLYVYTRTYTDSRTHGPSVTFLDVGQGDGILIQDGATELLVDTGKGDAVLRSLSMCAPQITGAIDGVLLTHGDRDHIEGLYEVLRTYPVGSVIHSSRIKDSDIFTDISASISAQNIPDEIVEQGDVIRIGNIQANVLWPATGYESTDENNESIVLLVVVSGKKFLLTGDAPSFVIDRVIRDNNLHDIDVLKLGHHGSRTSTDEQTLMLARPYDTIASAGAVNTYGHPHKEVLDIISAYGARILRTDTQGSIVYSFKEDGSVVQMFCK